METINRQLTTQKLRLIFRTANSLLVGGLAILVVWLGAERVMANTFSIGMLLAFIAYKDQFLSRVSELINRVVDLKMLRLHAERLADIALTPPEPRDPWAEPPAEMRPAAIEVRNLCFRYSDNDPFVLDGISFRVASGEFVAIAGPSGCGKTTLLKLLAGLLQPTEGEILVDGEPLARFGIERYRAMIGVVMQDDRLFAGSIADNICFFAERPERERIEACAKLAAVHDDILAMPMAYGSLIGDMGTVLSGGQKQRVLIARALYHDPGVLLLDEATSHLDLAREKAVNAAIGATRMTRIVVAHRPETIRASDRVIALEKGRLATDWQLPAADAGVLPFPLGRQRTQLEPPRPALVDEPMKTMPTPPRAAGQPIAAADIWPRVPLALLFVVIYGVAEVLVVMVAGFQLFTVLFTGKANPGLLQFGEGLSRLVYQITRFFTFNTDERPFPFGAWPSADQPERRAAPPPA